MRDLDDFLIARLRFKHLALIDSLGTLRSIRKVAGAIHISEPAASKALAEIEISFGFPLFERSAAGVVPTVRGEAVIEGARLLLNSLRHVRLTAASAKRSPTIRLGAVPFLAITLVPQVLLGIRGRSEDVQVSLKEGSGSALLRLLLDGELDGMLAVMSQEVVDSPSSSILTYRLLYTEALSVIAPKGHPLARRRAVHWHELVSERWVLPPPPSNVVASIRTAFLAQGVVPPHPSILSLAPSTNVALVAAGLGISAVPTPMVSAARFKGAIEELRVSPRAHLPPVSLVYRTAARDTTPIRTLQLAVEDVLAKVNGAGTASPTGV